MVNAESGLHDLLYKDSDNDYTENSGSDLKDPVAGHVHGESGIAHKGGQGIVGDPHKERICTGDDRIGGVAHLGSDIAADHTGHRMLSNTHEGHGSQGRYHNAGGVGGQVSDDADEHAYIGDQGSGNIFHGAS